MTTTHTTLDRTAPAPMGAACLVVGIGAAFLGAHSWGEIAVVSGVVLVAVAIVFGRVLPRALQQRATGRAALWCSLPALLLTVPAFWSGLPLVLGTAGMILGNAGRDAEQHSGKAIAALVLGTLAVLGYLGIYVGDVLIAGHVGFLLD